MNNSKESNRLVIQLKIMKIFQANQAYIVFVVVLDVYFDVHLYHLFLIIYFSFLFILFPLFSSRCLFYPVKISAQKSKYSSHGGVKKTMYQNWQQPEFQPRNQEYCLCFSIVLNNPIQERLILILIHKSSHSLNYTTPRSKPSYSINSHVDWQN